MPYLLRGLKKLERWDTPVSAYSWLTTGEVAGDLLIDLIPSAGDLSVYLVEDDSTNLNRVIAALASGKTSGIDEFSFLLISLASVQREGFILTNTLGETIDDGVNVLHRDITQLSVGRVTDLARLFWREKQLKKLAAARVRAAIHHSIEAGYIDRAALNKSILKGL